MMPQILCLFVLLTGSRAAQGVIISLKDNEGIIKSDEHGELPFSIKENLSDVEFTTEDENEEVEFTVITVRTHFCLNHSNLWSFLH